MKIRQGQIFLQWTIIDESEVAQMEEAVLSQFQEVFPDRPCTMQTRTEDIEL